MNIGRISGQIKDYPLLDHKLNELIEIKGTYLFNIICGPGSLGELWGKNNGSGIQYFLGDFDILVKKCIKCGSLFEITLKKKKSNGRHKSMKQEYVSSYPRMCPDCRNDYYNKPKKPLPFIKYHAYKCC